MKLVKVAACRDESSSVSPFTAMGSVPLYLNCPCGAKPATEMDGPDVLCQCGRTYDCRGWVKVDVIEEGGAQCRQS